MRPRGLTEAPGPLPLLAPTSTFSVSPISATVGVYASEVAAAIALHPAPEPSHRYH